MNVIPPGLSALRRAFTRTQPGLSPLAVLVSSLASTLVIAGLGLGTDLFGHPLLMTSFGASRVLEFVLPKAPVSQPVNVIGGHLVATLAGLVVVSLLPTEWWSMALATGSAVAAMTSLRILHPPAAGIPLIVMFDGESWSYLVTPVLIGAVVVTLCGAAYRAGLRRTGLVR